MCYNINMKKILTNKDIAKIDKKKFKEKNKRAKFELGVEVYMTNLQPMTYALLKPIHPFKSIKYWELIYYVMDSEETYRKAKFDSYREFKKFKKLGELREATEFEKAKMKFSIRFNGHFEITEVEDMTLNAKDELELDSVLNKF